MLRTGMCTAQAVQFTVKNCGIALPKPNRTEGAAMLTCRHRLQAAESKMTQYLHKLSRVFPSLGYMDENILIVTAK
jgi:hypothetical protein